MPVTPGSSPSAPRPDLCPTCQPKAAETAAPPKTDSGPMDMAWMELASQIEEHLLEEPPKEPRTTMQLTRLGHPLGRIKPKPAPSQPAGKTTLLLPAAPAARPPGGPDGPGRAESPRLPPSAAPGPDEAGSTSAVAQPPAGATTEGGGGVELPPRGTAPSADSAEKLPPAPSSLSLTEPPPLAEIMGNQLPIIDAASEEAAPQQAQQTSEPSWFQTALIMQGGGPPSAEVASSPPLELPTHTESESAPAPPILTPPLVAPSGFVRPLAVAHRSMARILVGAALIILLTGGVVGTRWWARGTEGMDRSPLPRVPPPLAVHTPEPSPSLASSPPAPSSPPASSPEPATQHEPSPGADPAPGTAAAAPQWALDLVQQARRLSCARPRKLRPQYSRLLSVPDHAADAHVGLAACALKEKELSAAIRSLEAALALHQNHPAAVLGLAFAARRSGDLERARAMYRRYLELPDAPEATKAKIRKVSAQLDKVR
ncbi:MAG: hypothetical protein NZ890_07750 [Myxococcota bacterium]|nr:hypothetical protein [Myxococcota bacterium]